MARGGCSRGLQVAYGSFSGMPEVESGQLLANRFMAAGGPRALSFLLFPSEIMFYRLHVTFPKCRAVIREDGPRFMTSGKEEAPKLVHSPQEKEIRGHLLATNPVGEQDRLSAGDTVACPVHP